MITHAIHGVDPAMLAAFARQPRLVDLWLGYPVDGVEISGIDVKRFATHPVVVELAGAQGLGKASSTDDGIGLECWLPGIIVMLGKVFADETPAWEALGGKASDEFPITPLGSHAWGFAPFVVRRLAGLLDVLPTWKVRDDYDAALLISRKVYPEMWSDPEARGELERAFSTLRQVLVTAADKGHAVIMVLQL